MLITSKTKLPRALEGYFKPKQASPDWLLLCYSLLDVLNGVAWFSESLFLKTPQYIVVLNDLHSRAYCT